MFGQYTTPGANTRPTASTRASSGHQGGSPRISSSLMKLAPPWTAASATCATWAGLNPSDGFTITPTAMLGVFERFGSAPNDGPGSRPSGSRRSVSRHRLNIAVSTASPATRAEINSATLPPQLLAGNSSTACPPRSDTTRPRTN